MRSMPLISLAVAAMCIACGCAQPPSASSDTLDTMTAVGAARAYEQAIATADYTTAWADLSTTTQQAWASYDAFAAEASGARALKGGEFIVKRPATDSAEIQRWTADAAPGTPRLGYLIEVDHPAISDNSGWEMLLVAAEDGQPKIWILR